MTIQPGTRLGPYEIVASIGAGGMGEVWRARDTRLDRDVAIKILPPGLAQNEQFLQRFEREAKAISQLNHPHVCTLYDVGEAAASDERRATSEEGTCHPERQRGIPCMRGIPRLRLGMTSLHPRRSPLTARRFFTTSSWSTSRASRSRIA